jgi:hypothetical protein
MGSMSSNVSKNGVFDVREIEDARAIALNPARSDSYLPLNLKIEKMTG